MEIVIIIVVAIVLLYICTHENTMPTETVGMFAGNEQHMNQRHRTNRSGIDARGYLRDFDGRLIHRSVAYHQIYKSGHYDLPFSKYDVHHKNGNKRDNRPENLEILTRDQHKQRHGH